MSIETYGAMRGDWFKKGINDQRATKASYTAKIKWMLANKARLNNIIRNIVPPKNADGYVNVSGNHIYITYLRLTGFKDPMLVETLTNLTKMTDSVSTSEYAPSVNRDFRFVIDPHFSHSDQIVVNVSAYVAADSDQCYKVKIGTETRETDKFEIVCI